MTFLDQAHLLADAKDEVLDGVCGHRGTLEVLFEVLCLTTLVGRPGPDGPLVGPLHFNELPAILQASCREWAYNLIVTRIRCLLGGRSPEPCLSQYARATARRRASGDGRDPGEPGEAGQLPEPRLRARSRHPRSTASTRPTAPMPQV